MHVRGYYVLDVIGGVRLLPAVGKSDFCSRHRPLLLVRVMYHLWRMKFNLHNEGSLSTYICSRSGQVVNDRDKLV